MSELSDEDFTYTLDQLDLKSLAFALNHLDVDYLDLSGFVKEPLESE